MNKFFLQKVKQLRDAIPATDSDPLARMRESMAGRTCTFTFQPVTVTRWPLQCPA